MAYTLAPRRIALLPIDHLLEHVHAGSATLDESFGATYVNNFLFLPADLRVSGRHGSLAFRAIDGLLQRTYSDPDSPDAPRGVHAGADGSRPASDPQIEERWS